MQIGVVGGGAPEASKELLGLFYQQEVLLHRLLAFPLHAVCGAIIIIVALGVEMACCYYTTVDRSSFTQVPQ